MSKLLESELLQFGGGASDRRQRRRRLRRWREERLVLETARRIARQIAAAHPLRICTVDRVSRRLLECGHTEARVRRAAGNVFRGPEWFRTPWRKSHRTGPRCGGGVGARTREVKVWRLRQRQELDPPANLCDRAFLSYSLSARGVGVRRVPPLEELIDCVECGAEYPISLLVDGEEGLVCVDCRRDG